jgi:outer membrane murein-binding lipoprotein Lpp
MVLLPTLKIRLRITNEISSQGRNLSSTQVSAFNRDLKTLQPVMNAVGHPESATLVLLPTLKIRLRITNEISSQGRNLSSTQVSAFNRDLETLQTGMNAVGPPESATMVLLPTLKILLRSTNEISSQGRNLSSTQVSAFNRDLKALQPVMNAVVTLNSRIERFATYTRETMGFVKI